MDKRNTTIVLSSSDDDEVKHRTPILRRSSRKSKSRTLSSRANSVASKKARVSDSGSRLRTDASAADELRFLFEDLEQEFDGFKVPIGLGREKEELWVDKYKPSSLEDLAVHKRKVEEVKLWFEERLQTNKDVSCSNVLVMTGPSGAGKSATVQLIASHLGAAICEWSTPTPTVWQEHMHSSNLGTSYTSKLDEFENFIEKTRKYGLIATSSTTDLKVKVPVILLIDDLPLTNGYLAYKRLKNCLLFLARSIQLPTVILISDSGKVDSNENSARFVELQLSLETVGARKVAFNPVTVNSIKKALARICRQEQCNVNSEHIDRIAKSSGGDIRHAIASLQYFSLKPQPMVSSSLSKNTPDYLKEKTNGLNALNDELSLSYGRDETLSLFHALGKFLHNKRETEDVLMPDQDAFPLKERLARLPLKMDAPEKILSQAHVQARPVADFLHENVLDFLGDEAINDAWIVASYLSDADSLLGTLNGKMARNFEIENLVHTAAASVAARGVLFGNSQPLLSRWHAIRRPKLWQMEQSSLRRKFDIIKQKSDPYMSMSAADPMVIATEFTPCLKWLGYRTPGGSEAQGAETEDENGDGMSLEDQNSEDEIEDW